MKMTADYMVQSVEFLANHGFEQATESRFYGDETSATVYRMRRGPEEILELEAVRYESGEESFHLQIESFHGLTSTSYRLDSWKYFDHRIEFKYGVDPQTGRGLSLVLWVAG